MRALKWVFQVRDPSESMYRTLLLKIDFQKSEHKPFLDRAARHQFGCSFGGSVRVFRQRMANWGSALVRRFSASEGTIISASSAIQKRGGNVPASAWGGRKCWWPALLCDPQPGSFKTRKQLITVVSPSLNPRTLRRTTEQLLISRRWASPRSL